MTNKDTIHKIETQAFLKLKTAVIPTMRNRKVLASVSHADGKVDIKTGRKGKKNIK